MIRVFLFLLAVLLVVAGLHWLADRPGTITVEWLGYVAETSMFRALIILAAVLAVLLGAWSALRQMWRSPAAFGRHLARRRERRGLDALTGGIIAVSAGDHTLANRFASQARKALPHEPLTHLLRAQVAQIADDRPTARRIFEAMLASPETEVLGLRGLYLEAEREGAREAARQFAERALKRNPKLSWPVEGLFDLQCRAGDWAGALETLAIARKQNLIDKAAGARRRAVLLTAQAQTLEDAEADKAAEFAQEAHRLAPDLIPAAAIAGRVLASRGNTPRAARVLLKTWRLAPHPDLAAAYAYARPGDSPRDRLVRVRHLGRLTPGHPEALMAIAISAMEAREWEEARKVLQPLLASGATQRVFTLMARIEGEQHGDTGRVREWLARAATAARDPAWVADGVVAQRWAAISPVTGQLDAMHWQVPDTENGTATGALAARMDALAGLDHGTADGTGDALPPSRAPVVSVARPVDHTAHAVRPDGTVSDASSAQHHMPSRAGDPRTLTATPVRPGGPPRPAPAQQPAQRVTQQDDPPDVPYRAKPATSPAGAETTRPQRKPAAEPRIFVPPRAPDDPGPAPGDADDLGALPFPTSGAKA